MGNQLWLPDVVSDAFRGVKGYKVDVLSGWSSRGRTNFNPVGVINHHTGGGSYGALLNYMAWGSSIAPLCNIATSRPSNGIMRITIVEAGRANHAGRGYLSWTGNDDGNYRAIGIENQNDGSEPWPKQQIEGIHILSAALLEQLGAGVDHLADHKTYAPSRKVDRHSTDVDDTRREVARIMKTEVARREYITRGDYGAKVKSWQKLLMEWDSEALPEHGPDSDFGQETVTWTNRFLRREGLADEWDATPIVNKSVRDKMDAILQGDEPDEWEVFWMSLTDKERQRLEEMAKALAAEDGTRGDHFVIELLKDHRQRLPALEKFMGTVNAVVAKGNSTLSGMLMGTLNAIDAVRDMGYEISPTERTGAQKK